MGHKVLNLVTFAFLTLGLVGAASAQAEGAQVTTPGNNETANTDSAENVTVQAGAVANVNVDQTSLTEKWAGFYGSISATRVLGSASDNLYQWTASTLSDSNVITTPQGAAVPTSLTSVTDPNTFLDGWKSGGFSTGVANASGTFNRTESISLLGSTISTAAVNTFNSSTQRDERFTTYLAGNPDAGSNSPVFIAEGNNDVAGFNTDTVNYQMLVGVGESASDETYTFYLELP